jgi:hypothetical protein
MIVKLTVELEKPNADILMRFHELIYNRFRDYFWDLTITSPTRLDAELKADPLCPVCREPVPLTGEKGRPKIYCSSRCKGKMRRQRESNHKPSRQLNGAIEIPSLPPDKSRKINSPSRSPRRQKETGRATG